MNSSQIVNIEDLRRMAQRRVPRSVFDYLDGGAESETTLTENCRAFRDITFRPRGAGAISGCKLSTVVVGQEISMPFILAPVGYSRLMHPEGELGAAGAAGEVTFRSTKIESLGPDKLKITGDLTIRGGSKPVSLDVEGPTKPIDDGHGHLHMGVSATGTLNRTDFGMTGFQGVVGNEINLTIDAELVQASAAAK